MNDKEKADKYDELVEKSGNGDNVIDIEGQRCLHINHAYKYPGTAA